MMPLRCHLYFDAGWRLYKQRRPCAFGAGRSKGCFNEFRRMAGLPDDGHPETAATLMLMDTDGMVFAPIFWT
jgi:hypothetical protein